MNTMEFPQWKLIERPLLPIQSSAVDAVPVILLLVLLGVSLWGVVRAARPATWRWVTRIVSLLVFVVFMHRCLCAIRGWLFGLRFIARDDLMAFNMLCVILPLIAFGLVAGRLFCGWVCALGFLQELFSRLVKALGRFLPRGLTAARWLPALYAVLILTMIVLLATVTRPASIVFAQSTAAVWGLALVALLVLHAFGLARDRTLKKVRYWSLAVWMTLGIIGVFLTSPWCAVVGGELDYSSLVGFAAVLLAAPLVALAWCRYLCPVGALLSLLARRSIVSIDDRVPGADSGRGEPCPTGARGGGGLDRTSCQLCRSCGAEARIQPVVPGRAGEEVTGGGK